LICRAILPYIAPAVIETLFSFRLESVDEKHARYHAYWMGAFATGGAIASAGGEVNERVRVAGQWLIRARDVDPQD